MLEYNLSEDVRDFAGNHLVFALIVSEMHSLSGGLWIRSNTDRPRVNGAASPDRRFGHGLAIVIGDHERYYAIRIIDRAARHG